MGKKFDIILPEKEFFASFFDNENAQIKFLNNASRINIFVGSNNSGKSRFIRELLNTNFISFDLELSKKLIEEWNGIENIDYSVYINNRGHRSLGGFNLSNLQGDTGHIFMEHFEIDDLRFSDSNRRIFEKNKQILEIHKKGNTETNGELKLNGQFNGIPKNNVVKIEDILGKISSLNNSLNGKKIYIPTLRTSHSIFEGDSEIGYKKISSDIYQQTLLKNYSIILTNLEIFTGLNLYNEIVNARNNVKTVRDKFEKFEKFISDNFFQEKKIDIVAKFDINSKNEGLNDGEIINIYIDGESKDLFELGDGIQAIIILLYKIYMAENNSIIFIDEPEINLHPGMQRLFLEQITTNNFIKKKNLTFFISTHSNHFLDLTIDKENISIFLFNKIVKEGEEPKFVVKNVNQGDNSALQYLGVTNSSVFLANCSIWVEGISDRNYLKAFLKAYCKSEGKIYPKEDIEFAFIEYAGSNIDHYNFDKEELEMKINAFSINNKILLISDFDGDYKQEKHNFYNKIDKENSNFSYLTTKEYKEIENILPFTIWDKILIDFCNKKKVKTEEQREDAQKRITEALKRRTPNDYKNKYIGEFLKSLQGTIPEINKIWTGNTSAKTLLNKAEVSYKVLEMVETDKISWKDFKTNSVIVKFTERLYKFIQNSNFKN